jgi:subtilisin family serine protease
MALIYGQELQAESISLRIRVVVKLAERVMQVRAGESGPELSASAVSELQRMFPDARFTSYFEEDGELRAATKPPFDRYFAAEVDDRESANALARRLQTLNVVEEAYVEGGPFPPPVVNSADDPRSGNQGYLAAAPGGIDARWAWGYGDGSGIGFVDLERGWTLNHEDLAGANITVISGLNQDFRGHGTSVLGEVVAVDNALGGVGIAPRATCRVVSQWRTETIYNTAAAILSAGQAMNRGDVLLLEAQTRFGSLDRLPVEVEAAVFDAIRLVTDNGVVVVEAAGNGGHDLDTFTNTDGRQVLNRNSDDFRDSGAIMVGAASSASPHTRLGFSCHGSRIDCFAWGENVDTTGDGWMGDLTTSYTSGFGGTSSATPIVAGAALLLQSWRKRQFDVYTPDTIRDLLSSSYNTPSANPINDRIGVMPDLRAIIERQIETDRMRPRRDNYAQMIYILFGLIDDTPGYVWVPGKGPVPVDPDWSPISQTIAKPKLDLLAALAMIEIVEKIADQPTRAKLNEAAIDAMRGAVDRIARIA